MMLTGVRLTSATAHFGTCCEEFHELGSIIGDAILHVSAALRLLRRGAYFARASRRGTCGAKQRRFVKLDVPDES